MDHFPIHWLFGLPSSGKTTLAKALRDQLRADGYPSVILDGDEFRNGLSHGLGFDDAGRSENIRRAAEVAKLLHDQGVFVICAFITPKQHHRDLVRSILDSRVRLVHIHCPLEVCQARDVKGLYQKAVKNPAVNMTGTQDSFAPASDCDLTLNTHQMDKIECCSRLLEHMKSCHAE